MSSNLVSKRLALRAGLSANVSAIAILLAAPNPAAAAQAPTQAAQAPAIEEEIVVTGSRIVRDGFQAPTPVSVVTAAEIEESGAKDLHDFVIELPQVTGSLDPQSRAGNTATGSINAPALRDLGTNRVLVLLDGQRAVGAVQQGTVDTSAFPQMLISRVDIVTGGASAAYGSDAIAGVMNYILDKEYTGFKTEFSGGLTRYGDDLNGRFEFAAGQPFAEGRGHWLLGGEIYGTKGVMGFRDGKQPVRDAHKNPAVRLNNPAYCAAVSATCPAINTGVPFWLVVPNGVTMRAVKGAVVISGPLKGTAWGTTGQQFQMSYGLNDGSAAQSPDWEAGSVSGMGTLDPEETRESLFARVGYDVSDNISVHAQASYAHSWTEHVFCCTIITDMAVNVAENAFLDPSVRAKAQALGLTTLTLGGFLDGIDGDNFGSRWVNRYVVGADGNFDALGTEWSWDAYWQFGTSRTSEYRAGNVLNARFRQGLDSVISPTTGNAVCRINADTNPANDNPACKPYNPFGWGQNGEDVKAWLRARYHRESDGDASQRYETQRQQVMAFSVSGDPISLWAGPVSFATGAEYRTIRLAAMVDADSLAGNWNFTNFKPTSGRDSVLEGYAETVIPLAKDQSWARSIELNAAVRATDYKHSGFVVTWKVGLSWSPIDDLRFRATRSRDIRAPNLAELFSENTGVGGSIQNTLRDPFFGNRFTGSGNVITQGNINLVPEKADTTGLGAVYSPSWLPGLGMSVDYYNIDMKDRIGTVAGSQDTLDRCFAGQTSFCANIQRDPVTQHVINIYSQPINFEGSVNRGIDFETSYRMPLSDFFSSWNGNVTFRWLATHYLKAYTDQGLGAAVSNNVGESTAVPKWKHLFNFGYSNDPWNFSLSARHISDGVRDTSVIECDSGCPVSTVDNRTVNVGWNQAPGYLYFDTSIRYAFELAGTKSSLALSVRNLMDQEAPPSYFSGANGDRGYRGFRSPYDSLGRTFSARLRVEY